MAEIRLRQLNREYILKRTEEIERAGKGHRRAGRHPQEPAERSAAIIIRSCRQVVKKYGQPRRTSCIISAEEERRRTEEDEIPDYPVNLFFTREGYFKKITPQSPAHERRAEAQGRGRHRPVAAKPPTAAELLFFTDQLPGLQGYARATLTTPRPACSGITCRQSWAWTRARTLCLYGGDHRLSGVSALCL